MTRLAFIALASLVLFALLAPVLESALGVTHDATDTALRFCNPTLLHPLGCDEVGRDLLARLAFAARTSLLTGAGATLIAALIGTGVGLVAGVARGVVGAVLMRSVDVVLSLPVFPLMLLLSASSIGGSSTRTVPDLVVLLAAFGWMGIARITRAEAERVQALEFIVAARSLGASRVRIAIRHVLPHVLPAILVAASLDVGRNILAESALSYLGLGVQAPSTSWGQMLKSAESDGFQHLMLSFLPGSLILLTVLCTYVLAEALRRSLSPRDKVVR